MEKFSKQFVVRLTTMLAAHGFVLYPTDNVIRTQDAPMAVPHPPNAPSRGRLAAGRGGGSVLMSAAATL